MHELADRGLLFQHPQYLLFGIEAGDHRKGAGAQIVQAITVDDPSIEFLAVADLRPGGQQALNGLFRMAVVGIVDRDVQGEVVGVDAQLGQLVSTDQQVQRQLFVTQIEADHLGQELLGMLGQRQLYRALDEVFVIEVLPIVAALAGEQLAVEHDMIFFRLTFAKLFQVGLDQRGKARVIPALQQAIEPGAVDQLGRRYALQKMQRMGLAGKIPTRRTGAALVEIGLVLAADFGGMPVEPFAEPGWVLRQIARQRRRSFQLAIEIVGRAGSDGFADRRIEEGEIEFLGGCRCLGCNGHGVYGQASSQLHKSHTAAVGEFPR